MIGLPTQLYLSTNVISLLDNYLIITSYFNTITYSIHQILAICCEENYISVFKQDNSCDIHLQHYCLQIILAQVTEHYLINAKLQTIQFQMHSKILVCNYFLNGSKSLPAPLHIYLMPSLPTSNMIQGSHQMHENLLQKLSRSCH